MSDARARILASVARQLRSVTAGKITLEGIAAEAGCAKGLLTYHFKSKIGLVTLAAEQLLQERQERWLRALEVDNPESAIKQTWLLISLEASSGFWHAWTSLASGDKVTVRTVRNATEQFTSALGASVDALLGRVGLRLTVTRDELGHLLAGTVQGLGLQLTAGANAAHLEGAYAALWAGILGLTRPEDV